MIGGGEFIINGAERVVVSQLHRSPGVDFVVEIESGDKKLHACRVIPERGSWIELQVTKKDTLGVRIDQSGKFSSMTLLRAMSPQYSSRRGDPPGVLRGRGRSTRPTPRRPPSSKGRIACGDVVDPNTGEVLIDSGATISKTSAQVLADAGNLGDDPRSSRTPAIRSSSSRSRKTRPPTTRAPCCGSTSGCGRATRRSSRRPASSSTRSSSTPTATGWARSAGSGSTASSTRRSPKTR